MWAPVPICCWRSAYAVEVCKTLQQDYCHGLIAAGNSVSFTGLLGLNRSHDSTVGTPLRGSSGTPFSFRALRVSIGLERFALGAKGLVYVHVLSEAAGSLMR